MSSPERNHKTPSGVGGDKLTERERQFAALEGRTVIGQATGIR
jgi:hypothetical protein